MLPLLLLLPLASPPSDELALAGLDPVALCQGEEVPGDPGLVATHGRWTYRFASEASRETFLGEPERWGIQWGGACGGMGPLSGRGAPDRWAVHDGRVWIFASDGCREGFLEAPERYDVAPDAPPEATADQRDLGRRWVERAVQAHGGRALDAARGLSLVSESERDGWTHRIELRCDAEGRVRRRSTWLPAGEGERSYDTEWVVAEAAFTLEDGRRFPLASPAERADVLRFAHREPLFLLWLRGRPDFVAAYTGEGELDGAPTADVRIFVQGLATTLHLDRESARVRGLSWTGRENDGLTRDVVETLAGWREAAGVTLPAERSVRAGGAAEARAASWTELAVSAETDAAAFR